MDPRDILDELMRAERDVNYHRVRRKAFLQRTFGVHPGQLPIVMMLDAGCGNSPTDLARQLCISPAAAGVSLRRLEQAGILTRQADGYDSRKTRAQLTDKGRAVAQAAREDMRRTADVMFRGFTQQECRQLCAFYQRMAANLKERISEEGNDIEGCI